MKTTKKSKQLLSVKRLGDDAIPPELRHLRSHPAFELAYRFPQEGLKHLERMQCEQSLLFFFERAWREIDPAPLKINWHHECEAAHLEAVTRGEIRRIVFNVPPRTSKTLLVNICWPAWCWIQPKIAPLSGPQVKFMCISYGQRLSTEIATLARRLVMSEWYQSHWGDRVKIFDDQGRIDNFGNTAGGFRIATSMTGSTLGRGGDCVPGNTEVITVDGPKNISELDISAAPEYVLTYGKDKTPTYRRVIAITRRRAYCLWRIQTRSGNVVEATPTHRFFTERGFVQSMALVAGDVLLRAVRDPGSTPSRRIGEKSASSWDGAVLQFDLRDDSQKYHGRETAMVLPRVWSKTPEQTEFQPRVVQRGMSPQSLCSTRCGSGHDPRTQLRNLQQKIPPEDQYSAGSILLPEMQGHCSFEGDDGYCQSSLSAWERRSRARRFGIKMVPDQERDYGSRRLAVHGLCASGQSASGTPYRSQSRQQRQTELDQPMRGMSPFTSCGAAFSIERDYVSVVEEICREEVVYDIQVEETETFFANGILIHNCRIIDDPQSVEDANSQIETENVIRTYREALQTRETDPQTSAEVLIMQRLGQDDLSGYILQKARDDVVHVMLPMRHIPEAHCTTQWYDDPRTERDELLWPEQFPESVVNSYEFELGPFSFAGQFMQQPIPRGGGIFKSQWFESWPPLDENGDVPVGSIINLDRQPATARDYELRRARIVFPALEYVVAWCDTAHTAKQENDFCAMVVLGVFRAEGRGRLERAADGQYIRVADDYGYPKVMVLGGWLKRLTIHGPPLEIPPGVDLKEWNGPHYLAERQKSWGLVEWIHHSCRHFKVDYLGIESEAAGHELGAELHRLNADDTWSVELIPSRRIAHGGKEARAYAVQGLVSSGQVFLPTFPDGTYPSWLDPILDQILMFPRGSHDDAVDAFIGALWHLRSVGIFDRREEWEKVEDQARICISNQPAELPYDL